MSKHHFLLLLALVQPLFAETATIQGHAGTAAASSTVTVVIDSDRDGLSDADEAIYGTNPHKADSDGDGIPDSVEIAAGTNPLVNQLKADPDLVGLNSALRAKIYTTAITPGRYGGYWDFENYSAGFPCRLWNWKLMPQVQNPTTGAWSDSSTGIWKASGGCLNKAIDLGPHKQVELQYPGTQSFLSIFNSTWIVGFTLKLDSPLTTSESALPVFSGYANTAAQPSDQFRIELLAVSVGSPAQTQNQLRIRDSADHVCAVWPIPSTVNLQSWNEFAVRVTDTSPSSGIRTCYVNGLALTLSSGPYTALPNPASGSMTAFGGRIGAVRTGGTITPSTHNFSVDRFFIANGVAFTAADFIAVTNRDTDGDGIPDRYEVAAGSNPLHYDVDQDNDGLTDAEEVAGQAVINGVTKTFGATNRYNFDSDGDIYDDWWEAKYFPFTDPNNASKPGAQSADPDGDGLSNYQEMLHGTNPNSSDTDGDGINDNAEVSHGSDPGDASDRPLNPADFYGDSTLGFYGPIGDLGVTVKATSTNSSTVSARVGDPSDSHSERWKLKIGDKGVVAPSFGTVSNREQLTLNPGKLYEIKVQHLGTDPAWTGAGEAPDYDYWASVIPEKNSSFLLCDLEHILQSGDNPVGNFVNDVDPDELASNSAWLVPIESYSYATSYGGGDAVGPKYRKVALNGRPIPDEKPQQEEESDQPEEETYVDAFNLGLHHDTSYHYTPLGASDLALQVTASTEETGFSSRSGLRPHERLDLPFGVGWSSNLCSYVEVVETIGEDSHEPVTVNVVDESGRSQRFGTIDFGSFFPWPSARVDKKTYLNTLTRAGNNFTLQKKFGSTLTFTPSKAWFMYSSDRRDGSTTIRRHTYWRLSEARDRFGVRLRYDYDNGPGVPNEVALIPRQISSPDREGQFLVIGRSSDSRRVTSITDSRGNKTEFGYTTNISEYVLSGSSIAPASKLTSVWYADGTDVHYTYDTVYELEEDNSDPANPRLTRHFHTNLKSVTDKRSNTHTFNYAVDQSKQYWDSSLNGTRAAVDLDRLPTNVKNYVLGELGKGNDPDLGEWKTMYGQPRRITSVVRPGGAGTTTFASQGQTRFGSTVTFPQLPVTTVTDALGNKTVYEFTNLLAEVVNVDASEKSVSAQWMIYYLTSKIHHGGAPGSSGFLGTETYEYEPAAGLALKKATDFSGNVTTWEFDNGYGGMPVGLAATSATMTKWADPTAKVDALGRRETYTYSNSHRIMDGTDDPYHTTSAFTVDGLGRRRTKAVQQNGSQLLQQERYDYGNARFQGFQTGSSRLAFSNVTGQAWETALETATLPDANGRIWKEITDPRGLSLVTENGYDFNNNKTWSLDPRGKRTRFTYDKLNRLTDVTYPEAGTSTGTAAAIKRIWYNENGSKAAEIDEEGRHLIHHYDALNRRITTIRDMDGAGLPTLDYRGLVTEETKGSATGSDLVSRVAYDAVGNPIRKTDPRGIVTRTFYDAIQRPVHVFAGFTTAEADAADSAGNPLATYTSQAAASTSKTHTEFRYTDTGLAMPEGGTVKGNPGGSAFNSSGFKPTVAIQHGAVLTAAGTVDLWTYASYDALYRPLRTETVYETGSVAVGVTAYGALSGGKEALNSTTTDDRGKVTLTVKDGLQRVTSVTDAYGTALATTKQTVYSSTGLTWKTIDPLNRESETDYDGAGRAVAAWQPDPVTGVVNRSNPTDPLVGSPRSQTAYDKSGNVTVSLDPLGYRHEFEYDARNRKTLERLPSVTATEIVGGQPVATPFQTPEIKTAYDGVGNVTASTDARSHVTRTFRDRANRVTTVLVNPVSGNPSTNPASPGTNDIATRTTYDAAGNALDVTDGNGNHTRNTYDTLNRLATTATNPDTGAPSADPANPATGDITIRNAYDDAGHLVKVTDGVGHSTGFRFDGLGRKTRTLWDEGTGVQKIEQATFDGLVQLTRTDPKNQTVTFQYDALHRLENVLYSGASTDNRHLGYDLAGNLLEVSYPNETTARKALRGVSQEFDKLNRLTEETSAGATHVHTYDKSGNRRTTTYASSGRFLASTYDKLNRLLTCTEKANAAATSGSVTGYFYDLAGNVTRKVLPNGTENRSTYDALNRKLGEDTRTAAGGLVSRFDYSQPAGGWTTSHDGVGNVLKIVEFYGSISGRTVTNSYDRAYRLTSEVAATTGGGTVTTGYAYDAANNRTQKVVTGGTDPGTWTSVYGTTSDGYNSNQLKSVTKGSAVTTFLYDANGNRSEKKVGTSTVQSYGYDYDNRLVSLTDSAKGGFAYAYDHRSRRVGRDESSAGGASTELSFSGGLSVQEYTSGTGTPVVELIRGSDWGGGIGGVLYTIRDGGVRSYNAYNSRGDVVSQTDTSGTITWQSSYEAFGTRTQEQGTTQDRQKTNTKDEDPTGLLNEGFRYRDLEFGIFLTRDPAGFVDGPNVYTYVRQNPWTKFDPEGLWGRGESNGPVVDGVWNHVLAPAGNFGLEGLIGLGEVTLTGKEMRGSTHTDAGTLGRNTGRLAGAALGAYEVIQGGGMVLGAGAGEVYTVGVASPVAIPVAVVGVLEAAHGTWSISNFIKLGFETGDPSPPPTGSSSSGNPEGTSAKTTTEESGKAAKGSQNENTREAATRGSSLHSDKPGNLPDQLRDKYPDTEFDFKKPGQAGQDVEVKGGVHPSEYDGSQWSPKVKYGDFKPDTPGGRKTFKSDQAKKWEDPTHMLPYDPKTGQLK
ncbi:RHS repeat-associated core domain-containing protein [Luteolibacter sp. LG18]|uniref:RHS repeat-associated core domain-containing protein n=1 Tax=Luteolibacter sp. LG18 TaxID=2819286 RepID=UPI002B2DC873|nr:hypothetical protein llg_32740 [Luteolibacter sp. LG18]